MRPTVMTARPPGLRRSPARPPPSRARPRPTGVAVSPKVVGRRRRVDDELLVELVPDVDDLAHHRDGEPDRPQHRPRDAADRHRRDAHGRGQVGERLPLRAGRRAGHVPRPAERPLVGAEGGEGGGDVGQVGPAARGVRVADRPRPAGPCRSAGSCRARCEWPPGTCGPTKSAARASVTRTRPASCAASASVHIRARTTALGVGGRQRASPGSSGRTGGRSRRGSTSSPGRRRCARPRRAARRRPAASRWASGGRPGSPRCRAPRRPVRRPPRRRRRPRRPAGARRRRVERPPLRESTRTVVAAGDQFLGRRRPDRALADDHVQCHGELLDLRRERCSRSRSMLTRRCAACQERCSLLASSAHVPASWRHDLRPRARPQPS